MTIATAAIPVGPASPGELRRCAEAVRHAVAPLRLTTEDILLAWGMLPAVYRAPEAQDLQDALITIGPAAVEIATGLGLACTAIETLADELEAIERERDALVERIARRSVTGLHQAPLPDDRFGRAVADAVRADEEAAFRRDCAALVDRWDAAVDSCTASLRAIPEIPWSLSNVLSIDEELVAEASTSITDAAAVPLLARLAEHGGSGAAALLTAHPEWIGILHRTRPAAVAAWWNALPVATAAQLTAAIPAVIGNLDGVAIAARVAANRARAASRVEELRRQRLDAVGVVDDLGHSLRIPLAEANRRVSDLDREIAYFQAVQDGRKQLYAWNPDHGSLIEMSGDPATATSALFVVPGTNTRAESFFGDEPVTRFANWQTRAGQGSVMSFTVMTGPMPQLSEIPLGGGPQLSTYASQRAPEYANFVQGVEATAPGVWTMSYEHSYAGAIGSAAEAYGGTVDARFMAATVGAIGPYTPDPQTRYFAAQAPDDINRYYAGLSLADLGFSVPPESFPGVQIVDTELPGLNPRNVIIGGPVGILSDSVEHHNALMSDDESINGPVLYSVYSLLLTQGKQL
ncbi:MULTISPECIES: hypothetical protein [Microbacterium]|uniref:hypothetical protein n=1 Tax=Microbacterium TaxID=33882 RepID=UPI0027887361|nr:MULTISPECIES: hypothetical protein [Microbacterium]MDQ1076585.1 hypothetical protein [Microbacterium sp. SORGH_AS_0969]MDQ1116823.1 hypothetical protein [Microbacterium testaceum]